MNPEFLNEGERVDVLPAPFLAFNKVVAGQMNLLIAECVYELWRASGGEPEHFPHQDKLD